MKHPLIREKARNGKLCVEEFVRGVSSTARRHEDQRAWMRFAAMVETGNPSSSESIDAVVYGCEGSGPRS